MDNLDVTTTDGATFSTEDSRELARLVLRRWGGDMAAAAVAWRRLMQNNCSDDSFRRLAETVTVETREAPEPPRLPLNLDEWEVITRSVQADRGDMEQPKRGGYGTWWLVATSGVGPASGAFGSVVTLARRRAVTTNPELGQRELAAQALAGTAVPKVGDGATECCWSDRHAYTIVEVVSPTCLKVQRDTVHWYKSRGEETYRYERDPFAVVQVLVLKRTKRYPDGKWVRKTDGVNGNGFVIGMRNEYRDPSF